MALSPYCPHWTGPSSAMRTRHFSALFTPEAIHGADFRSYEYGLSDAVLHVVCSVEPSAS